MPNQMPGDSEYVEALQNLRVLIIPPDLKQYDVVRNSRNSPLIYSGGFVITSQLVSTVTNQKLALRLFKRLPEELEQRYKEISTFVQQHAKDGIFVNVTYIEQGIKIKGVVYPICTMDWLDGETLRPYLLKHHTNQAKVAALADKFKEMITKLRRTGAAHGDLSHDNIIMDNRDNMRLIDYDGMFVPNLNGFAPVVAGQPNFQHPDRATTPDYFGHYQDNFSAICIYLSLLALQHDPSLFTRYENGGNLIFRKEDFIAPDKSAVFAELEAKPALRRTVEDFKAVCLGNLLEVPSLEQFLNGKRAVTSVALTTVNQAMLSSFAVFNAQGIPLLNANTTNSDLLKSAQGQIATLAGRVHRVHVLPKSIMLEFNNAASISSAVYIEGNGFDELMRKGATAIQQYANTWVKVTGVVEMIPIQSQDIPALSTDNLLDVVVKTGEEIRRLLRQGNEDTPTKPSTAPSSTWRRQAASTKPAAPERPNTGNPDNLFKPKKNAFALDDE